MDQLILHAIETGQQVEFYYDNLLRVAELHMYGITNGVRQILAYQVGGHSTTGRLPDWRRFDLGRLAGLSWDIRFAVVG